MALKRDRVASEQSCKTVHHILEVISKMLHKLYLAVKVVAGDVSLQLMYMHDLDGVPSTGLGEVLSGIEVTTIAFGAAGRCRTLD